MNFFLTIFCYFLALGLCANIRGCETAYLCLYGPWYGLMLVAGGHYRPERIVDGVLMVEPALGAGIFLCKVWFLSRAIRNALIHALNGNIVNSWRAARAATMVFFVLASVVLILDLLTGFRFGFLGFFRIVWATSTTRWGRLWAGVGNFWLRKWYVFAPFYVLSLLLCFPAFIIFLCYDSILMFIFVFWPEAVPLVADKPGHSVDGRRQAEAYARTKEGASVPNVEPTPGGDRPDPRGPYRSESPEEMTPKASAFRLPEPKRVYGLGARSASFGGGQEQPVKATESSEPSED